MEDEVSGRANVGHSDHRYVLLGSSGGPPMAVSPIGPVRQVLEYAISEMPAAKIMMGQNLYG